MSVAQRLLRTALYLLLAVLSLTMCKTARAIHPRHTPTEHRATHSAVNPADDEDDEEEDEEEGEEEDDDDK